MKMAIVGAGAAGLTMSAGFAELGHTVRCVDGDSGKIAQLSQGIVPYREPGLESLVLRNFAAGRLSFGNDSSAVMNEAELLFIAVATPADERGDMSLAALWKVIDRIEAWPADGDRPRLIAIASTVPVGTAERAESRLRGRLPASCAVEVVSIPEFMREGNAVATFSSRRGL